VRVSGRQLLEAFMLEARGLALVAIALMLCPLAVTAQHTSAVPKYASATAKRDAQASTDALLKGELERFASFVYPRALKVLGGKDKLIATVQRGLEEMRSQGVRMASASVGEPEQMMRTGGDLLAIIPIRQVAMLEEDQILFSSHLLGISSDNGRSWTFVDTMKLTPENVREFIPSFHPAMKLPINPDPTYVPANAFRR